MLLAAGSFAGVAPRAPGERAASGTVSTLLGVAFSSPSRGVGLFVGSPSRASAAGPSDCTFFTRPTWDGGASFGAPGAAIVRTGCGNGYVVDGLAVDAAAEIFVYGPAGVFASRDAGASWQPAPANSRIVALAAVGPSMWALGESSCPKPAQETTGMCTLTLFEAAPSGRSWRPAPDQPPQRRFLAFSAAPALVSSSYRANAAAIVLTPDHAGTYVAVEQTVDGGGRWRSERAPCAAGPSSVVFSIAQDGTQWLACGGEPGVGEQSKSLARSLDNGRSWQESGPLCRLGTTCPRGMPLGGYLGGLAALSANTAFYVGGRSALTVTHDSGRSWQIEPGFSGGASGSADVTFVNSRDGWAIDQGFGGRAVLWRTRDGGGRWVKLGGTP